MTSPSSSRKEVFCSEMLVRALLPWKYRLTGQYGAVSIGSTNSTAAEQQGEEREFSKKRNQKEKKRRSKAEIKLQSVDIIRDHFWEAHPWLLTDG